jgi:hypothetical protein
VPIVPLLYCRPRRQDRKSGPPASSRVAPALAWCGASGDVGLVPRTRRSAAISARARARAATIDPPPGRRGIAIASGIRSSIRSARRIAPRADARSGTGLFPLHLLQARRQLADGQSIPSGSCGCCRRSGARCSPLPIFLSSHSTEVALSGSGPG